MAKYSIPKYYVICTKYRIKPTHLFIGNDLMQKLSENKDLLENAIVSSKHLQKKKGNPPVAAFDCKSEAEVAVLCTESSSNYANSKHQ